MDELLSWVGLLGPVFILALVYVLRELRLVIQARKQAKETPESPAPAGEAPTHAQGPFCGTPPAAEKAKDAPDQLALAIQASMWSAVHQEINTTLEVAPDGTITADDAKQPAGALEGDVRVIDNRVTPDEGVTVYNRCQATPLTDSVLRDALIQKAQRRRAANAEAYAAEKVHFLANIRAVTEAEARSLIDPAELENAERIAAILERRQDKQSPYDVFEAWVAEAVAVAVKTAEEIFDKNLLGKRAFPEDFDKKVSIPEQLRWLDALGRESRK